MLQIVTDTGVAAVSWTRPIFGLPGIRDRRWLFNEGSLAIIVVASSLAACGGDSSTEPHGGAAAVVEQFAGANQWARVGEPLQEPVVVRLLDAGGSPVAGATVTFVPTEGHGAADPWATRSDSAGLAATMWTLGDSVGEQVLAATVREGVSTEVRATAVAVLPDLIASLSPGGAATWAGGSFEYVAIVRNRGDTTAAATQARTFVSADNVITTSDEVVGAPSPVPALAPGESASRTGSFTVNSAAELGTVLYVGECVEPVEWEADTGNNCSESIKVTVAGRPDLSFVSLWPDSAAVAPGSSFEYVVAIQNRGAGPAAATKTRMLASSDSVVTTSDEEAGEASDVPTLGPGESASRVATFTVGASALPRTVLWVGECVDPVEGESDTGNNCSAAIKVRVTGRPDLVVGVSPDSVATVPGGSFEYAVEIRNRGAAASVATTVGAFLSADSVVTTSDDPVGQVARVPALDPHESVTGTASMTVSRSASPGTVLWVGECVDPVEGESDTANNCSSAIKVTIVAAAGLRATGLAVVPRSDGSGSGASLSVLVAVVGPAGRIEFRRVVRGSQPSAASGCLVSPWSTTGGTSQPTLCRSSIDFVLVGSRRLQ